MKILLICIFVLFFSNPVFSETKNETTWSNYSQWYEGIPTLSQEKHSEVDKVYVCLDYASSFPWVIYRSPVHKKGELVCEGNTFGPAELK
jgi:hypothetical protein